MAFLTDSMISNLIKLHAYPLWHIGSISSSADSGFNKLFKINVRSCVYGYRLS